MTCTAAQKNPLALHAATVMEKMPQTILFLLLLVFTFVAAENSTAHRGGADEFHVGVILDLGSLVGKVSLTSISLAVEDFYSYHPNHTTKLAIHIRDSMGSEVQAVSAGMLMLQNHRNTYIILLLSSASINKRKHLYVLLLFLD